MAKVLEKAEKKPSIRVGCGAGFANDRMEPAVDLARRGQLDYLIFEGLAERTLAHSHLARMNDPTAGFNQHFLRRLEMVLPVCQSDGLRIITNMGAANPTGAGRAVIELLGRLGYKGKKIAVVTGDDITGQLTPNMQLLESGKTLAQFGRDVVGANAYLGGDVVAQALDQEADIVITGRLADPSLVVGPLIHEFGWQSNDWKKLGAGTLAGHLLECSAQVTGGYFADPGYKDVPDLANIGYPFADVSETGDILMSKLEGTGGCVTPQTVLEQMLYEVHDPAAYLTPDVTADFSQVKINELRRDTISINGATGRQRPDQLKATIGFRGGFLAEAEISYAGPGAAQRAQLAAEVLRTRMEKIHQCREPLRIDLIGLSSLLATTKPTHADCQDVRLRAALRTDNETLARQLPYEVETLWIAGPAGGGGMRGNVTPTVLTQSVLIDRDCISPQIEIYTV